MSILLGRTRTTSAFLFFFNDTATTEIYTLSLHDALPISAAAWKRVSFSISLRHWAKALARLRSGADLSRLRISGPGSSSAMNSSRCPEAPIVAPKPGDADSPRVNPGPIAQRRANFAAPRTRRADRAAPTSVGAMDG